MVLGSPRLSDCDARRRTPVAYAAKADNADRDEGARGVRGRPLRRGAGAVREAVRRDAAPGLPAQHRALPPEDAPARQGDRRVQRVPRARKRRSPPTSARRSRATSRRWRRCATSRPSRPRRPRRTIHSCPAAGDADREQPAAELLSRSTPPYGTPTTSGTLVSATPPPPPAEQPIYKKWWFWTGIGVVVAGGVVAAVVLSSGGTTRPPCLNPAVECQ